MPYFTELHAGSLFFLFIFICALLNILASAAILICASQVFFFFSFFFECMGCAADTEKNQILWHSISDLSYYLRC